MWKVTRPAWGKDYVNLSTCMIIDSWIKLTEPITCIGSGNKEQEGFWTNKCPLFLFIDDIIITQSFLDFWKLISQHYLIEKAHIQTP